MRLTFFLSLTIFGCAVVVAEYYSDAYDNTNVESIMKNERLLNPYLACLLDRGSCTADGRALKTILPDAMATNCERCSDKQKSIARQIGRYLTKNKPDAWAQLCAKYDPDNRYIQTFKEFLDAEN